MAAAKLFCTDQNHKPCFQLSGKPESCGKCSTTQKETDMKLTLEFDMDGAAFDESWQTEAARILRELASRIADGDLEPQHGLIGHRYARDINGNAVGRLYVTD